MSVQSPPTGREVSYVRVLAPPVLIMAAAGGLAVAFVPREARIAVAACAAVALVLVLVVALRSARARHELAAVSVRHDDRIAFLQRRVDAHEEEALRLGRHLLPEALARLRQDESPAEVMRALVDADPVYRELPTAQRELLHQVLEIVDRESAMRESAQRAFVNIARRVQTIVHRQAAELREMEDRHGRSPDVFDDLLRIDHGTALIGRLADSITVLGGARPGRQWPRPVPLYSVLRGAMSRILDHRRIDLDSVTDIAVLGTSVEPLIHACAELLDNATRYSPPQTRVHVTAAEVQTGIAIEIEDGGVSLSEEARGRAERMLAQAQAGIDLDDLGESPRLGLAVVGRLSQMYGLQVALRQSAYGGVRAVLVVPRAMLTTAPAPGLAHGIGTFAAPRNNEGAFGQPAAEPVPSASFPGPMPATAAPADPLLDPLPSLGDPFAPLAAGDPEAPDIHAWRSDGLPQRRSRLRHPAAPDTAAMAPPPPRTAPDAGDPEPGLWLEAFMNGEPAFMNGEPGAGEPAATAVEDIHGRSER